MAVAKSCHGEMRKKTERVITLMKVDDYDDRSGRLAATVASAENKLEKHYKVKGGENLPAGRRPMAHWTGKTITLQIGTKWTYKLELWEESGGKADLVLGRGMFNSEAEAKTVGETHLKAETEKRST